MLLKIKQLLCFHRNITIKVQEQRYISTSGKSLYYVCNKCGKIVGYKFIENNNLSKLFKK